MKANKGKRPCPPAGREITPAECGANRHRQFACPGDCPFNPFAVANYDHLLEIEEKLDLATLDWLQGDSAPGPSFAEEFGRRLERDNPAAVHSFVLARLLHRRDAAGLNAAQRWERAGCNGLKNDALNLFRAKCGMRTSLIEIHRVLDHERVEAVDLLAPAEGAFILLDRHLAAVAVRFSTYLGWRFVLPHFHRFSGAGIPIPTLGDFAPEAVVQEILRHLGGPAARPELDAWLTEHVARFQESLGAAAEARRQDMLAGVDARFGKAVYELRLPFRESMARLDADPAVEACDLSDEEMDEGFAEARDWFEQPPTDQEPAVLLGRVLLGQAHWRLEATGGKRFARLRERFETLLGDAVKFTGERLDDLGAKLAQPLPADRLALVPPRLRENPTVIELSTSRVNRPDLTPDEIQTDARQRQFHSFLRHPVPALAGLTPPDAARDPAVRPRLIQLLKDHVRKFDEDNLRRGCSGDINWLLHELGAHELIFPPPPLRAPPAPAEAEADPFAGPEEDFPFGGPRRPAVDPTRAPAPALPAAPLTVEEANRRVRAAMEAFDTAGAALDELAASGATVLEDLSAIIGDQLDEGEFSFLLTLLLPAWFGLVPLGVAAPALDYDRLEAAYDRELDRIEAALKNPTPTAMQNLPNYSPQPDFALVQMVGLLDAANTAPKAIRPPLDSHPIMLAAMFAVIAELDRALRPRT